MATEEDMVPGDRWSMRDGDRRGSMPMEVKIDSNVLSISISCRSINKVSTNECRRKIGYVPMIRSGCVPVIRSER